MDGKTALTVAESVLRVEASAVLALTGQLNEGFLKAVEIILRGEGRVIFTGVGKSGHVGRKLAATMASTGTPALFMHADEAMHGDLGMVTEKDVVIMISNSGETPETLRIVPFVRNIGATVIALVGKPGSTLGKVADAVITAHVEREADPLNLAPTASCTAALAMGDALAIAVMVLKGFTRDDFRQRHPGGSLGRMLATGHSQFRPEGAA